ncbi:GTP-binding protein Di-Ras2-like [Branchiostoma floridae x Branchiostoma japonicum]
MATETTKKKGKQAALPSGYRVVVLGDGGVGKSSLIRRFVMGSFEEDLKPTLDDIYLHPLYMDGRQSRMEIVDTGGTHTFPSLRRLEISRAHALVLVYSASSLKSFIRVTDIMDSISAVGGGVHNTPIIIVGNKFDTESEESRQVPVDQGFQLARLWNCRFMEGSVKSCSNVDVVFEKLIEQEKRWLVTLSKTSKMDAFRSKVRKAFEENTQILRSQRPRDPWRKVPPVVVGT